MISISMKTPPIFSLSAYYHWKNVREGRVCGRGRGCSTKIVSDYKWYLRRYTIAGMAQMSAKSTKCIWIWSSA
jgi:hypothetical protein